MKKIYLLLLVSIIFISCSGNDSNSDSGINYMSITRDGKTFTENNLAYGSIGVNNCKDDNVSMSVTSNARFIENSKFSFTLGFIHFSDKSVFEDMGLSGGQINIEASENGFASLDCYNNLDFTIFYHDKINSVEIDDSASNTNTIESINFIDETSTEAKYGIKGKYKVAYTDGAGYNITINGSYLFYVSTYK
jgi:hypothetical protein